MLITIIVLIGVVWFCVHVAKLKGQRAAEVTRGVSGVQRVIKVFDYIDENELKQVGKAG